MDNQIFKQHIKDIIWFFFQKSKDETFLKNIRMEDKDRPYYIIVHNRNVGLFSYIEATLRQALYAIEQGYIPVVDMMTYPNAYLEDDQVGKINSWEFYFKQLNDCKLEEIYESQNYILSAEENRSKIAYGRYGIFSRHSRFIWGKMYNEFLKDNEETKQYIDREFLTLLNGNNENTLGVLVRGTDYNYAIGHPKQPNMIEVAEKVEQYMKGKGKGDYEQIYLATEERKVVKYFEKRFPGRILTNKRIYFDEFDFKEQSINEIIIIRENDRYLRGLEYLSSIRILSKCGGFVGGLCGGSYAAVYMNCNEGKLQFSDCYLYKLGMQK